MDTTTTPIRCNTLADLPAFVGHAHAVVMDGERFGWWTEHAGAEPVLAFVLDKEGAAFRLCSAEGEIVGLFADFFDCVRTAVTLFDGRPVAMPQEPHTRPALSAPREAN